MISRGVVRVLSWVGVLCIVLWGCAPEEGRESLSSEGTPTDTALVVSSDPELRQLASTLLPTLADRAGLALLEPVRVERRSREQLERYLVAKLDDDLSTEEAGWISESYGLLGLVPPDLDLRGLLLSVYTEQVAGFYDPDSTALFVMDDQSDEELSTVLIHELVHAVQDQAVDLEEITDRGLGNDRQTAAQAAIEGQATLVMIEFMLERSEGRRIELAELPDMATLMQATLGSVDAQYPALAMAPPVFQEALLFPYLRGAAFVQHVWESQGHRASVLDEFLPVSTEQVLDPDRLLEGPRDDPVRIGLQAVDGSAVIYANSLGQLETGIFLETRLGSGAAGLAEGWDGDRFALVEDVSGARGLVWAVAWDDEGSRDRFVSALEGRLAGLPADGQVLAMEVGGKSVALIRLGPAPVPAVTVEPWEAETGPPGGGAR